VTFQQCRHAFQHGQVPRTTCRAGVGGDLPFPAHRRGRLFRRVPSGTAGGRLPDRPPLAPLPPPVAAWRVRRLPVRFGSFSISDRGPEGNGPREPPLSGSVTKRGPWSGRRGLPCAAVPGGWPTRPNGPSRLLSQPFCSPRGGRCGSGIRSVAMHDGKVASFRVSWSRVGPWRNGSRASFRKKNERNERWRTG
jgi:hypothetical protein